jgi:membrane protease YdiL (CAAX protease family)
MPVGHVLRIFAAQTFFFVVLGYGLWLTSDEAQARPFLTVSLREVSLGLGLAGALIAASAVLARLFPAFAERMMRAQAKSYPFLKHRLSPGAIVFLSACAGIGEEALFRGGAQTWLAGIIPAPAAIAIAAALFAAIHFAHAINSLLIFLIGCLFGLVYWQTGSLLAVVIGHGVYDVYAIRALQDGLHRLGVFEEEAPAALPPVLPRETLDHSETTTGEEP